MKYWAHVDDNNIVVRVVTLEDGKSPSEISFLNDENFSGRWIETNINDYGGKTIVDGEVVSNSSLRYNYASVGYNYDEIYDAFYSPNPTENDIQYALDMDTFLWTQI